MNKRFLIAAVALGVSLFIFFDGSRYLTLAFFTANADALADAGERRPVLTAAAYFVVYVLTTALSLPGAAVLTLIGGALFGFGWGLAIASFASTIGATLAFLLSRTLLRNWVQQRFGDRIAAINRGMERDGPFYLFTLRLVPIFPFFVINLLMGLTPLSARTFYWVSQIGMLAGTAVYVNAGTQLARTESVSGLLSPTLLLSLAMLGIFPWLARAVVRRLQLRRALRGFVRPRHFDYNLIVIGAGAAGLVTAYIAAAVKAKVMLIEKASMGGDCLNTGCVPSKALIRSARIAHYFSRAQEFGIKTLPLAVDFSAVMQRVQSVIRQIEPHDSAARYTELGVDCVNGAATVVSPWEVEVNGRRVSAGHIVIASGGRPKLPAWPGIDAIDALTSDTVWQLQELPRRLLVIGGGPIGCELAQAFCRLGAAVTLVARNRLLPKEDEDVSAAVAARFADEGIKIYCDATVRGFTHLDGVQRCRIECASTAMELEFDRVLVAVGRVANTEDLGLEKLGVALRDDGTVDADELMRTRCPTILACGDVAGPYQFTHVASHQAWYAAVNALFGAIKSFRVDYRVIPWATFCDPEVARVGLNEQTARAQNIAYEVTRYGIDDLDRAITDAEANGFVKILTVPGKDVILGVAIVGYHASELLAEYVLAMKYRLGLNKILGTIHIYPTFNEANKYAAGVWKQAHKPKRLLRWVEWFHRQRR